MLSDNIHFHWAEATPIWTNRKTNFFQGKKAPPILTAHEENITCIFIWCQLFFKSTQLFKNKQYNANQSLDSGQIFSHFMFATLRSIFPKKLTDG